MPDVEARVGGMIDADDLAQRVEQLGLSDHVEEKVLQLIRDAKPHIVYGGLIPSREGPEAGSRYRITISSSITTTVLPGEDAPAHYDADWWGQLRTVEVRAQSLQEALDKAREVPFPLWFEDPM